MHACWPIFSTLAAAVVFQTSLAISSSPLISSVSVRGNTQTSSQEILQLLSSRESLQFSDAVLQRDLQFVAEYYRGLGFLTAMVESVESRFSSDSSSVDLILHIKEGKKTVIGTLRATGNTILTTDEIFADFDTDPGESLDHSLLETDIDALLIRYEQLGHPLASCEISELMVRPGDEVDSLDVHLIIDEGRRVAIDEVRVEGNSETDLDVIVRETRLEKGDPFDPDRMNAVRERLQRLNIFSHVAEPELYMRNGVSGILIKVQEGRSNTFDGAIGYVPGSAGEAGGFFAGLASVSMRNLFGTGRKFGFRWEKENRNTQELGVNYLEPWILGVPVNVGAAFFQRQQDTSFVRRSVKLNGEFMVTEEFTVGALFESDHVIPSAGISSARVLKTRIQTVGAELVLDTRNDFLSPTSGTRYRIDAHYGIQRTFNIPPSLIQSVRQRVNVRKLSLDLDFFLVTFPRQVLAVGLHGKELRSDQIDEGQMYRMGGARTLRGYRENQFFGSRIAWTNTEYRFLLARRTFIYGFVDTGYYFRPKDDLRLSPKAEGFKYGYGLGLLVETSLGYLGVSFALGQGDSFNNGKIHFGLINEF